MVLLFDPTKKFVRVTHVRVDGFVEFDFAVGEEELFVEMILPTAAFEEFCKLNEVTMLEGPPRAEAAADGHDWRLDDVVGKGLLHAPQDSPQSDKEESP